MKNWSITWLVTADLTYLVYKYVNFYQFYNLGLGYMQASVN